MRATLIIPSYRRPHVLARCLQSVEKQKRRPDAVLVSVRDTDAETQRFLRDARWEHLGVQEVPVTAAGLVAAYNAALEVARGDIISFLDDDATPHPDWLARVVRHFEERSGVGGVGGRDWMYLDGELQDASVHPGASAGVGRLQWHGRVIGNHHLGEGAPREVDVLKGANMSYRQEAIDGLRFDERLSGNGSQSGNDFMFSLSVKQRGWTLLYDPAVAIDHHLASRSGGDVRPALGFSYEARVTHAHNETLLVLEHLPWYRRLVFLVWGFLVGTRDDFGLVQMLRFLPEQRAVAVKKWLSAAVGRWQGWRTFQRSEPATPSG